MSEAARTILAAFAHPDDEVGCAGTLASHRSRGDRVVLLWLTRGERAGSLGRRSPAEVARLRTAQGEAVAGMLGCEARFLDFPDARVEATAAAAWSVARVVCDVRPDAVVTWGEAWVRGMRHPDHQATGKIVRDAVTLARIGSVVAPMSPHRSPVPLFTLRDAHSALPVAAVDVTAVLDQVLEVARYYREQVGWPDEAWLRQRLARNGDRWGVAAAELFDAWETPPRLGTALI